MAPTKMPANKKRRAFRKRGNGTAGFGDGTTPAKPTTLAQGVLQVAQFPGRPFQLVRTSIFSDMSKAAIDQGYAFNWNIATFINSPTDFTGLFDQYRVAWMEIVFQWTNVGTVAQPPTLFIAQDWDGVGATPSTADIVTQHANLKVVMFDATHRTFSLHIKRPAVLMTAPTGNSIVRRSPYVDLADLSVTHFGPIVWANQYNTALASGTLQYLWRVGLELRGIR